MMQSLQNALPVQEVEEQSTSHERDQCSDQIDRLLGTNGDCLYPVEFRGVRLNRSLQSIAPLGQVNKPVAGLASRIFEKLAHMGNVSLGPVTLKDVVLFLGEILGFLALSAFAVSATLALSFLMNGAG